jgi:hypothetical protein
VEECSGIPEQRLYFGIFAGDTLKGTLDGPKISNDSSYFRMAYGTAILD